MGIFHWTTAEEVAAKEPEKPDYIIDQLIVRGTISQITSKIKIGKTTWLHAMIKAVLYGDEAMGQDTKQAKVLYLTEEGPVTFTESLRRNHLDHEFDLGILHLQDVPLTLNWANIANGILELCLENNVDVVVFDTLTRWARIPEDKENDSGIAAYVMQYLEILRKARIAVITVFHEKKSGGDIHDSTRGSGAWGGAADTLIHLTNPRQNGHSNRRRLETTGRLYEPKEWLIDYKDGIYTSVRSIKMEDVDIDDSLSVEGVLMREKILEHLTKSRSTADLANLCGVVTNHSTFRRELNQLLTSGQVERSGSGTKGSSYLWTAIGVTIDAS